VHAASRLGAFLTVFLVMGCYTLQPISGTAPQLGTAIAFDINDAGRLALGGSMGPDISQIEGRLVSNDASEYVIGVSAIRLLRGGEQVWHGETVHIKSEYVSSRYERRLSKSRTLVAGAVGVGAIAFIVSRSLLGAGTIDQGKGPDSSATAQRRPRP
jgi:hypothetical protein